MNFTHHGWSYGKVYRGWHILFYNCSFSQGHMCGINQYLMQNSLWNLEIKGKLGLFSRRNKIIYLCVYCVHTAEARVINAELCVHERTEKRCLMSWLDSFYFRKTMAKERPAEIRGLFNIPVNIISRKIFLPKIINKYPKINLKEKKHGQTHCVSDG